MTRIRLMLNILAVSVVCVLFSSLAHAQATRTWVSGVGDDANPCSRTAPCKTFAGAISKTATGGEINVLDPGGFGAVTITKAITILSEGNIAGVLVSGTNGIIVNAPATDTVTLIGLDFDGLGTGLSAIKFLAGKHLHVENCLIQNFSGGSGFAIEGANAAAAEMSIVNTTIVNCHVGIRVGSVAGNSASISRVNISRGDFGVDTLGGTTTIKDSVISHQLSDGLAAEGSSVLNIENCSITNNGNFSTNAGAGVLALASSLIRVANCAITGNTTGVSVGSSVPGQRFGNNRIIGNTVTDVSGTLSLTGNQ